MTTFVNNTNGKPKTKTILNMVLLGDASNTSHLKHTSELIINFDYAEYIGETHRGVELFRVRKDDWERGVFKFFTGIKGDEFD